MWDTIREAIKTNGGTVRFIVIVMVLIVATVIAWRLLGTAAPSFFAAVSRIIGAS